MMKWRSAAFCLLEIVLVALGIAAGIGIAPAADRDTWVQCMQTGSPAKAIKSCAAIIDAGKELPDSLPYAHLYRARAYAFCHQDELAAKDFGAASQLEPKLAHPYYGLGEIAVRQENFARAEEAFSKAIASDGEDADVEGFQADSLGHFRAAPLAYRGFARFKQSKYEPALADFAAATKLCPTCSPPVRNKGLVLAATRRFGEAGPIYDHAIALRMHAPENFWGRGFLMAQMSKFDLAVINYSEAIRLNPKFVLAYKYRAMAYAKLGKNREADEDRKQEAAINKAAESERISKCQRPDAADDTPGEDEAGGPAVGAGDASGLDDAAITALFSGKTWNAKQGPWQANIEFRHDGSFRQRSKDETPGSTLAVTTDGAWGVSRNQLCIYTSLQFCLTVRNSAGAVSLTRNDGTLEYAGAASNLQNSSLDNTTSPIKELPLDEKLRPGVQGATGGKKTLLYYIHGFDGRARVHSPLPQYFLSRIQESTGWDVIDVDFPFNLDTAPLTYFEAGNFAAAAYVARRIKEFKAQGYERIIVGGQSWGGWTALILSTQRDLPLDGILMIVPACCGRAAAGGSAAALAYELANNKLYFDQLIRDDRYPTAAVFFAQDEYETADRGAGAAVTLTEHGVANLVINHPAGFKGHFSAWLPVFDYEYRDCIVSFLLAPKTTQCASRTLSNEDFRVVFAAAQLGDRQDRTVAAAELIGKAFAVYPDGTISKIVSPDQTLLTGYSFGEGLLTSSFRDGTYCVRGRIKYMLPENTDEVCVRLVRWSDRELLAIDKQSGKVVQWWVEEKP